MFGYKINRGYSKLTIWEFDPNTQVFVGTETFTPDKKRTRVEKYFCIVDELKGYGINPPDFDGINDSPLTVKVEVENGVEKSREHFLVGIIPVENIESEIAKIIGEVTDG